MDNRQIASIAASTDLGENAYKLAEFIQSKKNSTFVDIGVRHGYSSSILGMDSKKNKNTVYGIDVNFDNLIGDIIEDVDYYQLAGDSVTIGKHADLKELESIDVLFVDSLHMRCQVLCELYYWVPRLKDGGTIIFHDSHWPEGKRSEIGGKSWRRVDEAITDFFNLDTLKNKKDDNLTVECYSGSWGMTFITVKDVSKLESKSIDWNDVFQSRNELISIFWNKDNVGDRTIELELTYEPN